MWYNKNIKDMADVFKFMIGLIILGILTYGGYVISSLIFGPLVIGIPITGQIFFRCSFGLLIITLICLFLFAIKKVIEYYED